MPIPIKWSSGEKVSGSEWNSARLHRTTSYVIFKEGTTYYAYAQNSGSGDYSGSDASTVIQAALDALTSGRTWKEKIVLKGDFGLSTRITIPSYTILEIQGRIYAESSMTAIGGYNELIIGSNIRASTPMPEHIDIIGGLLDGIKANQSLVTQWALITFFNGRDIHIKNTEFYNSKQYGLILDNCHYSTVKGCYAHGNDLDGFLLVHSPTSGFTGCYAENNGGHGFNLTEGGGYIFGGGSNSNTGSGVQLTPISAETLHCVNARILGMKIDSNGGDGIKLYVDGAYATYYAKILANTITNNTGYGVNEVSGGNLNFVAYNNIQTNTAGQVYYISAGTIVKGNIGYITENRGYNTITTGSGSLTHGLDSTPTYIQVNPSGSSYMGQLVAYPSGSAGIWVVQTGSGTVNFYWEAEV